MQQVGGLQPGSYWLMPTPRRTVMQSSVTGHPELITQRSLSANGIPRPVPDIDIRRPLTVQGRSFCETQTVGK